MPSDDLIAVNFYKCARTRLTPPTPVPRALDLMSSYQTSSTCNLSSDSNLSLVDCATSARFLVQQNKKMSSTRTETQTSSAGKSTGPAKLNKDPTIAQIFESLEYGPAPEAASSVNSWLDEHGRDFGHFVNGKWVKPEGRRVYETRNPATGER